MGRVTPVLASGPGPGETTEGSPGIWDLYHALETPGGVGGSIYIHIYIYIYIYVYTYDMTPNSYLKNHLALYSFVGPGAALSNGTDVVKQVSHQIQNIS